MAKILCTVRGLLGNTRMCGHVKSGGDCGFTELGKCDHQRAGQWWAIHGTDGHIVATAEGFRECSDKAFVACSWGDSNVAPYYLTTIPPKGAAE